jgi:AcrR family transcriptional regulator
MSPRTSVQFKEIREEKRSLIMDTAMENFASKGFHNTTINQIALQSGISKGLMYNYFESKDELLAEIIDRSVSEMYKYFDTDRDGILTGEEFELFIRKLFILLKEKRSFWRLFIQMVMQKDVMDGYLKRYAVRYSASGPVSAKGSPAFISGVAGTFMDYFLRRKPLKPATYDPVIEMNMCINTIKGLAMTSILSEDMDNDLYEKTINRIIEIYKYE